MIYNSWSSNRQHLCSDDYLEDNRKDYQNCFRAVRCTAVVSNHIHAYMYILTGELGPVILGLRLGFSMYVLHFFLK